jgi:hypothetical protein
VAANEAWAFNYRLWIQATSNWKFEIHFPSGTCVGSTLESGGNNIFEGTGTTTTLETVVTFGSGAGMFTTLQGLYVCGGTGGNMTLWWACSTAVSCVVKANSTLWVAKVTP